MDTSSPQTITALEPQVKSSDRLSVFLNGEFAVGVHQDVAVELGLRVGQRITVEMLHKIVRNETARKAMDRALLLLSYRARTEKEIKDRLRKAEYEDDIIDEVVSKLYALNYLDDKEFAEKYIDHRRTDRPTGRRALQWELQRKGITGDVLSEAVAGLDDQAEREMALTAARSRMGRYTELEPRDARRKLAAFLQRRGFAWDTITSVLDDVLSPEDAG